MHQFNIAMHSFNQVQEFVKLAMNQPFDVIVGNEHQSINGKDIMGMFSLDYRYPLQVTVTCSDDQFVQFQHQAETLIT